MRNKIFGLNLDLLKICYETENKDLLDYLITLNVGERFDCNEFYLIKIEGKYYEYVFQIKYNEMGEDRIFGELKYGVNRNDEVSNKHTNGKRKVWISLNNRVLYSDELHYLPYISDVIGLEFHNFTAIDLCLDMTKDISKYLKRLLRCKSLNVILNGKHIRDRSEDRPEITYISSGNLDKDKYLTVSIKQKKAIKDKSQGCSLLAYNKKAEIKNSSDKEYILDYYGNPNTIHRLEVHLNNNEIKDYFNSTREELGLGVIFNQDLLSRMFFHTLNSLIRFEKDYKIIKWSDILDRDITTPPANSKKAKKKISKITS